MPRRRFAGHVPSTGRPARPFLAPRAVPVSTPPLPRPALALSWPPDVAPPPPEPPRVPSASPAPARACNASPGLKACSVAAPRPSLLTQALLFLSISLSQPPRLAGPPPQPLLADDSRRCRLLTPIQYSCSTTTTYWCSPAHPISFSHARTSSPAAPASSSSSATRPRRRPDATPPLSPNQGY
jgi:hypothetical protein